ncbi:hypothetical protein IE53DRAFT_65531 [Violaceomyces palustris]|uniref:Uncharacterized protein n=1 Tax=Violaceomyces palustris TaxID=1673888 RepID=A0ACD0NZ25_9BASI|nr:hypothetical protein IE53DRAFT_65531 [Violaceomyces palustris]
MAMFHAFLHLSLSFPFTSFFWSLFPLLPPLPINFHFSHENNSGRKGEGLRLCVAHVARPKTLGLGL